VKVNYWRHSELVSSELH